MVIESDGAFRTKDMTEAALLASQGFKYTLERQGDMAMWVFEVTDENQEELEDITSCYVERSARVEPRAFISAVATIRNELYKFLGQPPRRATSSSSRP